MQKINFLKLSNLDIENIANLEKSCFGKSSLSKKSLFESFKNDMYYFVGAKIENKLVGYAGMYSILSEGYVLNIAVDKNFRKLKIGSNLVINLLEKSRNLKLNFLTLEVRESNLPAIKLYEKFDFKKTGIRKDFYNFPKENAIIMTYTIK